MSSFRDKGLKSPT